MKKSWSAVLLMMALGATAKVGAENAWTTKDYDFYSGDFDGDSFSDLLYIARRSGELSGIALFDGTGFNLPLQSWGNAYLGIPWSSGQYRIVIGDFNGDGKDDLFLQRNTPGDHYLLLAENGGIGGIYQAVPQDTAGIAWSGDEHEAIVGDFNGDGRSDLYFQPIDAKGLSAIVLADNNGQFTSKVPDQSWDNGYAGFDWSKVESLIFTGDFDANGQDDLLIQALPLPGTGPGTDWPPEFLPNANGVVLAQDREKMFATEGVQAWNQDGFGAEWSPIFSKVVIGDFNGDQHADALLQAQTAADKSYLLYGKTPGAIFRNAAAMDKDAVPAADEARVITGRFSTDKFDVMYFQGASASQSNALARVAGTGTEVLAADVIPAVFADDGDEQPGVGGMAAALAVTAAGRTPGQFSVSAFGGATYQIPLWTPPGARGIDPNLALVYTSGGADGPLGTGWSLAGLSAIARCGKTYASSAGSPAPVALTTSDDICLDGNRLRKTSGTQLVAGSTYQTEIEIFSRVTAYGAAGNGPSYFIVEGKDGLTYEYGNTADSKAYALEASTPYAWMLNKVRDRQGNNLTVAYSTTNGDIQPTTISYTQTPATSTVYRYTVAFTYQNRVTDLNKYVAGVNILQTKVLGNINIRQAGTSVRQYILTYQTAPTTKRDRLQSVQECGGSAGTDCLRPTTITYQNGTAGIASPTLSTGSGATSGKANTVDIDGDGRMDLVYATLSGSTYTWRVKFATSSGFGAAINTGVTTSATDPVIFDDFDGNGRVDLLTLSGGVWHVLRWNGSAFTFTSTGRAIDAGRPAGANWDYVSADVNGDGLPDLVSGRTDARLYTRLNTTTAGSVSFSTTVTMAYFAQAPFGGLWGNNSRPDSAVRKMDFNGDGRDDVFYLRGSQGGPVVVAVVSQGTTFVNGGLGGQSGTPITVMPANWNDDTCTDLIMPDGVKVAACNGAQGQSIPVPGYGRLAVDWDGDGRTDFLSGSSGNLMLNRSLGSFVASPVSTGIPVGSWSWMAFDQNGDGLGDLAFVDTAASNAIKYGLHNGANTPADLATTIADGWGISASPTYVSIAQSSSYTKGSGATFPTMDFQGPIYVVNQATQSDGRGGTYSNTFSYYGAQIHRQGRGFLGFDRTRTRDSRNSLYQDTYYRRDFPYTGRVRQQDLLRSNGTTLISRTENEFDVKVLSGASCNTAASRCFPYVSSQTVTMRELTTGSPLVQTSVTDFVYDTWGNPTSIAATATDSDSASPFYNGVWTSIVTNVYTNNVTSWCLGLPTQTTTQNTAAGQPSATRRVDHTVDAVNCRFLTETIEPVSPTLKVATTFGYDTCGNVNSVSVVGYNSAGTALPSRVTTSGYGTRCTFAETITNPLNEVTTFAYNYNYGVKSSTTDPNGVSVSWLYDNFARRTRESRPDATYSTWGYEDCISATCWGEADLRMRVTETQYSPTTVVVRSRKQHLDGFERLRFDGGDRVLGVWTATQIKYDSLGRKQDVYQPYSSASNGYHRFSYDVLNRPTTDTWYSPSGSIDRTTSIAYAGLKATYTDAKGNATQKWTDVTGKLRRIIDPSPGGTTNYTYDSFGNLKQIQDATSKLTTYTYNIRGSRTSALDPDTGSSTFTPNSLNELELQVDAKGQMTTFTYDKLGRLLTRLEPESATPTTWVYGTSAALKEIGRLKTVSKLDGYGESYTYDSLGRPASVTYTEDTTYQVNYTYNNIGALDVVTYPTSTSGYRLALKHNYSYGFLQQVKDNASSATYWTLNSANDYSSPVTELLGNAVTTTSGYEPLTNELTSRKVGSGGLTNNLQDLTYRWDDNGNLDQRQDLAQSLTETLTYDALNRLKTATVTGGTPLNIDYDAAGNIKNKSDVSATDYDYTTNQAGCTYTGLPAQPHAVRNASGVVYCYDANGNMTKRGGSNITWYSYNQPNSIASGSNSTQFNYNASYQRWRQVAVDAGATTTTYYVGGILEKVVRPGGVTEYRHLIPTGSGTAIYIRRSDATNNTYYMTTDHLGSGDLVLGSSGNVLARESFTPFGQRRGSNWQGLPSAGDMAVFGSVSRRGFTGHEMLDAVGLVNMNGRVYDPRIGRFLSADPIIQTISFSQALNPYTYVMNNPLTLIDPSGYSWLSSIFKSIGRFLKKYIVPILIAVVTAVVTYYAGPWWGAFAGSALSSVASGELSISFGIGFGDSSASSSFAGIGAGGAAGPLIVTTTTIPTVMTMAINAALETARFMNFLSEFTKEYLRISTPWLGSGDGDRMGSKRLDSRSESRLAGVHPSLLEVARRHIGQLQAEGIDARVISGYRSYAAQDALYARGRTAPGPRVTRARGGESYHNFGVAYDIAIYDESGRYIDDGSHPSYVRAAEIGRTLGLEPGASFTDPDPSHFQFTNGIDIGTMRRRFEAGIDVITNQ